MTSKQISNKAKITELFTRLSKEGYNHFEQLIKEVDVTSETLMPFATWSTEKYQRICLAQDHDCELILICWGKGQGTHIHNHDQQKCWVHVLQGELTETIYKPNSATQILEKRAITSGSYTYLTDKIGNHKLENQSGQLNMSLHLYAKPIKKCQVYCGTNKRFVTKKLKFDIVY